ncbi:MAG: DHA2 family efflux MFS transporter permease subunit [Solirubrobacteraceae bacterium]|nr:DHA2 family efflux MFS transporter permease subunit [Solirubrobacteraceae bacterium]
MAVASAPAPAAQPADPTRWWTLFAVCLATLMLLLDVTVVNVALPSIGADLDSSFSDLQWVVDAYALGLAALLLTWGGIADQVGRKRVFVGGLIGFTIASVLCAASMSPLMLNLARGLQGFAGAAMFATALALLASTFHGQERGTAIGLWGATTGGAVAIGPVVGGILIEISSWHWIFLVNVPIGIIALAITLKTVREAKNPAGRGIDVPGALTFSLGLFVGIFAIVRGNAEGWGSPLIVGAFVATAVLLIAFFMVQRRSPKAMFDLTLFRNRSFVGACLAAFAMSAGMFSLFLYITLWLQNGLGLTALEAGLRVLPLTLLSFVIAPFSGRLSARVSPGLLIGVGLTAVGVGVLMLRAVDGQSDWTAMLPGFILIGIGIGVTNPPLATTAVGVVDVRRAGMASGINNTFRQVGTAVGTAAFGAAMAALVEHNVRSAATEIARSSGQPVGPLPDGEALTQGAPALVQALPGGQQTFLDAYTASLDVIFLVAGILALVSAATCALLIRKADLDAAAAITDAQLAETAAAAPA